MEIYVVNETPYWDRTLEDPVKNTFKKYFADTGDVHFGREYSCPSEYYRWHIIIAVESDGYIRVRVTDKYTNYNIMRVGYVPDKDEFERSEHGYIDYVGYLENDIFKISHLLEMILKEFREHYAKAKAREDVFLTTKSFLDTDIASMYPKTKVKPMTIEEARNMMYDEFITDETWNRYMKGENTMITRTEMLDRATKIKEVKFNPPATIVFWNDGTKTVVKSQDDEAYDPEKGLAMAIIKKHFACNKGYYNNLFKKYCGDFKVEEPKKEPVKATERPKVFTETAEQYSEEVKKQKKIGDGYDDIHWEENKRGRK